ncbi:MAG: outer membrane beta-barrel protein, partial [Candidatus Aminicenantes bacterium]|nr:outer membrane beta-barrel protein [Candidatus Aminicenantes bacterium]
RWRLGAFRVNAAFSLSNVGYDSDVFYGYFAEPVPDYTFSAGVPIQVLLPLSKKVVLDIFDSPQYVFYLDTKNERAWNNIFRGQVHFAFDRVYVQLGGGLSNVRYRLSPELNVNVRQKQDRLDGLILWQASKRASLAFVYGSAKYDFGEAEYGSVSLSDYLNRKEDSFDLITYIEPSPRVRFFVDGQYGSYAFTKEEFRYRDARSYGIFGGIEFIPRAGELLATAGISGSLRLGYQRLDVIDPRFMDGSGLTGEADVSVSIMKRNAAHIFFSRGFQFSVYSNSSYYLATAYGGGISRLLSKKASLSYEISFGSSLYPGSGAPEGFLNRYTTHSFGLNLMLARQLSLGFLGTLGKRTLDSSGLTRNRNFFGFNLIYGSAGGAMSAPGGGMGR